MIVRIKASRGVYRRCGVVHTPKAVDHPGDRFTDEELERLQADPVLTVTLLDGELETSSGKQDGEPGTDDTLPPAGKEPGKEARPVAPRSSKAPKSTRASGSKGKGPAKASAKAAAKPAEKPASEPAPGGDGTGAPGASSEEQASQGGGQE